MCQDQTRSRLLLRANRQRGEREPQLCAAGVENKKGQMKRVEKPKEVRNGKQRDGMMVGERGMYKGR